MNSEHLSSIAQHDETLGETVPEVVPQNVPGGGLQNRNHEYVQQVADDIRNSPQDMHGDIPTTMPNIAAGGMDSQVSALLDRRANLRRRIDRQSLLVDDCMESKAVEILHRELANLDGLLQDATDVNLQCAELARDSTIVGDSRHRRERVCPEASCLQMNQGV